MIFRIVTNTKGSEKTMKKSAIIKIQNSREDGISPFSGILLSSILLALLLLLVGLVPEDVLLLFPPCLVYCKIKTRVFGYSICGRG